MMNVDLSNLTTLHGVIIDLMPSELLKAECWTVRVGEKSGGDNWNEPENWHFLSEIPEGENALFVLTESPFLTIDADGILDENGNYYEDMLSVLDEIREAGGATYTEVSCSGRGLHIVYDLAEYSDNFEPFCKAIDFPNHKRTVTEKGKKKEKISKIEFFFKNHAMRFTGNVEGESKLIIGEKAADAFIKCVELWRRFNPEKEREKERSSGCYDKTVVLDALYHIPVKELTYHEWIECGIGLYNAGLSVDDFDSWSQSDIRYESKGAYSPERKWKTFSRNHGYSAGTIIYHAKRFGWMPTVSEKECSATTSAGKTVPVKKILLKSLNDTEVEAVDWLIPGYIPQAQITLLAGDGGSGKTSLWCNLAAAVTTGKMSVFDEGIGNPFWTDRKPGNVLFFSAEDSVPKVLKRRLQKAGADESRVHFLDLTDENFKRIMFDSSELKQLISTYKPQLCVFDPLQSFIPGTVQMGSRNQMRQCLSPLVGLGEAYGTTFVIVLHTNKKQNVSGRMRIADSADIWDIARSVLIAGKTEGRHYLSHEKSNYGELSETLLFSIDDGGVVFEGTTTQRDRDFVLEQVRETNRVIAPIRSGVKDFILDYLGDGEPHETKDVAESVALTGASRKTFDRAKRELRAEKRVVFFSTGFGEKKKGYMQLPSR